MLTATCIEWHIENSNNDKKVILLSITLTLSRCDGCCSFFALILHVTARCYDSKYVSVFVTVMLMTLLILPLGQCLHSVYTFHPLTCMSYIDHDSLIVTGSGTDLCLNFLPLPWRLCFYISQFVAWFVCAVQVPRPTRSSDVSEWWNQCQFWEWVIIIIIIIIIMTSNAGCIWQHPKNLWNERRPWSMFLLLLISDGGKLEVWDPAVETSSPVCSVLTHSAAVIQIAVCY